MFLFNWNPHNPGYVIDPFLYAFQQDPDQFYTRGHRNELVTFLDELTLSIETKKRGVNHASRPGSKMGDTVGRGHSPQSSSSGHSPRSVGILLTL